MTATEALQSASRQLAADPHLADNARRDAELLLLHTLDITRAALLANPARELTPAEQQTYKAAITRRLRYEPIQYIIGTQEFYGLPFHVTPAVLIPRPETELLVEAVLQRLPHDRSLTIADIGTGSGAIAIALAAHLPKATLTALDLSPEALAVAQSNAAANSVTQRIRFLLSDLLSALPQPEQHGHFDAIVSNPPYVPLAEAVDLHPQVREHEPALRPLRRTRRSRNLPPPHPPGPSGPQTRRPPRPGDRSRTARCHRLPSLRLAWHRHS